MKTFLIILLPILLVIVPYLFGEWAAAHDIDGDFDEVDETETIDEFETDYNPAA